MGAWGALFPSSDHDVEAPALPVLTALAVRVFSKTNGFRHLEAIDAGVPMFKEFAAAEGWSRCVGQGSAFYSALGHSGSTYADRQHRQLLLNAMRWSIGEGCSGQR